MTKQKGVSEIVATVLMIMIVTLIGFTVLLYGMGYFSGTTSARNAATTTAIQSLEERFVIVDVQYVAAGGNTTVAVTVYNYGQMNINIGSIYLNGTQLSNVPGTLIFPNQNAQVNGTYIGLIPTGGQQLIRVVTSLGNYYENYYPS